VVLSPTRAALNSEATSELIDAEVPRIVEESHRKADRPLAVHRDKLEALAQALLKAESLNEKVKLSVRDPSRS
jgi:cell division protease FtsH